MAAWVGYAIYSWQKRKKATPEASRMFLERTGYRYADIVNDPIEAHVRHGEALIKKGQNGYKLHMVRDFHGMPVHSIQTASFKVGGSCTSYTWTTPLAQQPRVLFQVADKSLSSVGKAVREAFSNTTRNWSAVYPQQIASGDAELDHRFNFYGPDARAVQWLVSQPGMRDLLLGCTEVDLTVYPDRIAFSDPFQKNIQGGMGGMVSMMAGGTGPMKIMELSIPVHDRMATLLATTARSVAA